MRQALVTLAIGQRYEGTFRAICEPGWRAYADAIGCDLIVFTEPLDDSERAWARSPAWQKLLVFSHPAILKYDAICYADSDILINPNSPSLFEAFQPNSVGLVRTENPTELQTFRLRAAVRAERHKKLTESLGQPESDTPFAPFGIMESHDTRYNTGVMLCRPREFAHFFQKIYDKYEDMGSAIYNYEQWPLLHELLSHGFVHDLDVLFNILFDDYLVYYSGFVGSMPLNPESKKMVYNYLVCYILKHGYFLHFAGRMAELELIDPGVIEL
ncbi:MAG: hypothetical protein K9H25_13170 [Rhodospirillum sp.]|nr:hypothetical protein [Rhodospirillum sp.]MCF8489258.1 hypothetical protein [Rhodospirillum sp.]MCF8502710.1 hypothetical protein [Rhodospirillum sp.]